MEFFNQDSIFKFTKERYKITKPIRLISFFSGYDSQALGLKYANIPYEHYKTCEWATKSIQALKDLHFSNDHNDYSLNFSFDEIVDYLFQKGISLNYNNPMSLEQIKRKGEKWCRNVYNNIKATHNLVNIQQVKGGDLEINECNKYDYLLTYSFPCVTNDSLILTKDGYKEMKDVNVGELVLTKSNTWQKVAKKFDNGIHQTCFLNAMGFENIHCTLNHKFYVRTMKRKWDNKKRTYIRNFNEPSFKEAKDLTKNDYLGIPVIKEETQFYTNNLDFWFVVGMYLGDGWLPKNDNAIFIACNDKKLNIISEKLKNHKWNKIKTRTCWKIRICDKEMRKFLEKHIGTGSGCKKIPYEILSLPKNELNSFYEGYLSSDGCCVDSKRQFTSINKKLIYSISLIINKLFHRPTCIYKIKASPKKIIENRIVNQKDWYQLRFNINNNKQDKAFYENGYIWYPFCKIELAEKENVYNMEVENDHSYVLQGCISKNCQDLSLAGKRAGMKDTSTRSGMLWEVERILNECEHKPQILLMENVPQVHSQENMSDFSKWIKALEEMGYSNYYEDLNGKDYGIPQNRNRTFMVSILGDYYYEFPFKQKLKICLKDMLEENVDEKYYLTKKQMEYVLDCHNVALNSGRDINDRVVNPNIAKTISCRGAVDQRADVTNFVIDNVDEEITVRNLKEQLSDCLGVVVKVGNYSPSGHNASSIVDTNGIAPTVMENHGTITAIVVPEATKKGYALAQDGDGIYIDRPHQKRGVVQKGMIQTLKTSPNDVAVVVSEPPKVVGGVGEKKSNGGTQYYQQDRVYDGNGIAMCHPANLPSGSYMYAFDFVEQQVGLAIRKLTPKECGRLMGVKDEDIDKMAKNQSEMSLYHLFGDSLITTIIMEIIGNMIDKPIKKYDIKEWQNND